MSISFHVARTLLLAAAASLAFIAPVMAAEPEAEEKPAKAEAKEKPAAGEKAAPAPQPSLGERMGAIHRKLAQIREAALKANPKLVKRQEKLDALMLKTVKEKGVDPEKDEKRLAEIKAEIRAMNEGKFDQQRRLALTDEHRAISLRLAKAREEAAQEEKVSKTREALREDILAAMRKQDPETDRLLAEMEQLAARARDINAQKRQRR